MSRADKILRLLKKKYRSERIALKFSNPFELLVATVLSAQCTDTRVNIVAHSLFKKYKRIKDYAQVSLKSFQHEIHSVGFYRNKAKNIIAGAKKILKDFSGKVPQDMEGLLELPGVARKTANVVLYSAFGKNQGIAVDTHVLRLSQRLGLTKNKDPVKVERDLMELVPQKSWGAFSLLLIRHGREVCIARRPRCLQCILKSICPSRRGELWIRRKNIC